MLMHAGSNPITTTTSLHIKLKVDLYSADHLKEGDFRTGFPLLSEEEMCNGIKVLTFFLFFSLAASEFAVS